MELRSRIKSFLEVEKLGSANLKIHRKFQHWKFASSKIKKNEPSPGIIAWKNKSFQVLQESNPMSRFGFNKKHPAGWFLVPLWIHEFPSQKFPKRGGSTSSFETNQHRKDLIWINDGSTVSYRGPSFSTVPRSALKKKERPFMRPSKPPLVTLPEFGGIKNLKWTS